MSTTAVQQPLFTDLAAGLSDQCKAEFFKTLHETGIGPKDVELARLLRALQLYKAYYETIPTSIEKVAGEIERIKQETKTLAAEAKQSAEAGIHLSSEVIKEAKHFTQELAGINKHVETALQKSAEDLAARMAVLLNASIEDKVLAPMAQRLAELAVLNGGFEEAIARNKQAATSLHRNAVLARRIHLGAYSLAGLLIVCSMSIASWLYLDHWYSESLDKERAALVGQANQNRAVLLQLVKSRRTLDLHEDPEHPHRKLLVMKDASGWQSKGNNGVIEFSE